MSLALVRGTIGPGNDGQFIRGRIAIMVWVPGWMEVLLLANQVGSWVAGVTGIALLLFSLWLFVYRGDQVAAFVRLLGTRFRKRATEQP